MKIMLRAKSALFLLFWIGLFLSSAAAQTDPAKAVLSAEDDFWTGYNTCNAEKMGDLIADDVEFYHDKGGMLFGKTALLDSIKKNLCSDPKFHTRREAVAGTVSVYLLKNANVVYGAVVAGDHYFFNSRDGKPEIREGLAKFTTLWLFKDERWKMSRVLSFDHQPAPPEVKRKTKK